VAALVAGSNVDLLVNQALRFRPRVAVIGDQQKWAELESRLRGSGVSAAAGPQAVVEAALFPAADLVLAAMAGAAGLPAVHAAIGAGQTVALANKEPLVMAGDLLTRLAAKTGASILPVDSEHSAIFQLLAGHPREEVCRVILTASGGPFRELSPQDLARVTPEQALAHPTWRMGKKVTVDSATLMNKGLELIEARWLFDFGADQIEVLLHPQSIVHSLVELRDGCLLAHLGYPDMRTPIQFALSFPERRPVSWARLDLAAVGSLNFEALEPGRWPCLELAREALNRGGTAPAVMNAANELAVGLFLERKLSFSGIPKLAEEALARFPPERVESVEQVMALDAEVKARLREEAAAWTG
jgi:1-deoxy-D-xylulose-5-phosphate reductoisomerase